MVSDCLHNGKDCLHNGKDSKRGKIPHELSELVIKNRLYFIAFSSQKEAIFVSNCN